MSWDLELLAHTICASEVVDPVIIQDVIGSLCGAVVCHASEDGVQEGNSLDDVTLVADFNPITDFERPLHEKQDA